MVDVNIKQFSSVSANANSKSNLITTTSSSKGCHKHANINRKAIMSDEIDTLSKENNSRCTPFANISQRRLASENEKLLLGIGNSTLWNNKK